MVIDQSATPGTLSSNPSSQGSSTTRSMQLGSSNNTTPADIIDNPIDTNAGATTVSGPVLVPIGLHLVIQDYQPGVIGFHRPGASLDASKDQSVWVIHNYQFDYIGYARCILVGSFVQGIMPRTHLSPYPHQERNPSKESVFRAIASAYINKKIADKNQDLTSQLDGWSSRAILREISTLQQQRKTIVDDLAAEIPGHYNYTMDNVYTSVTRSKFHKLPRERRVPFEVAVEEYYHSSRTREGKQESFCHFTGNWYPAEDVATVRIVPWQDERETTASMFGVEEIAFNDPRNGITLHKNIAPFVEDGHLVLIAKPQVSDARFHPKVQCFVLTRSHLETDLNIYHNGGPRLKQLKSLAFSDGTSSQGPALRFLFFRFFTLYMRNLNTSNSSWWKVDPNGPNDERIWSVPGHYLHKSEAEKLAQSIQESEYLTQLDMILRDCTFVAEE